MAANESSRQPGCTVVSTAIRDDASDVLTHMTIKRMAIPFGRRLRGMLGSSFKVGLCEKAGLHI